MNNITGKILSIVFLFHLLVIQGVNIAEARHQAAPASNTGSHEHFTSVQNTGVSVSIVCEADELEEDDDEKISTRMARIDAPSQPLKFFADLVRFSFSLTLAGHEPLSPAPAFSAPGTWLLKAYCCFLI